MRNAILACTMAVLTAGSVALPALADDVFVTGQRYYDDGYNNDNGYRHHRHRPGIVINDRGVTFGSAEQRDHYRNRDRCSTKTMTRQTDDGSEVTKTIRRCD
ncbi:hypothetical protein [Rhizobium tubonense]|uniref:Uncharacterized protein n=1 Tax=Rhizobium tubonense TaxID=484088 RepID=A0A2W4CXX5_9HYPH|nr:hypothetical protein [Rhizobium tubonense]PZM15055.1 hypothetical protein CPY51_08400 [Rhizobium tubonense]